MAKEEKTHKIRLGTHHYTWNRRFPNGESLSVKWEPGTVIEVPDELYKDLKATRQRGLDAIANNVPGAQPTFDFEDVGADEPVEPDNSIPQLVERAHAALKSQGKETTAVLIRGSLAKHLTPPEPETGMITADETTQDVEPAATKKGGK